MDLYSMLKPEEAAYHNALVSIAIQYGPFDKGTGSIWVGYEPPEENEKASIGVKCSNCSFHYGNEDGTMGCRLVSFLVQGEGYCRLAAIPDDLVNKEKEISEDMSNEIGKQSPCWEGYVQRGMKPGKDGNPVPNCVPATTKAYVGCNCKECLLEDITCSDCEACDNSMGKAEKTYSPNAGMKSAARRALKWKADGKATGAGTAVGWGRATDIVSGNPMSLSTVKRMYSFFSRHEVDKKGKDWDNAENPSNGKIMWMAWGGDAGYAWSRAIVERAKANKTWQGSPFSI